MVQTERREPIFIPGQERSNKPLPGLISEELMLQLGFNFFEHGLLIPRNPEGTARGYVYSVHARDAFYGRPNLFIIEDPRKHGAVRWTQWFVGHFDGKPMSERREDEEVEEYYASVRGLIVPTNIVEPSRLKAKLEEYRDKEIKLDFPKA